MLLWNRKREVPGTVVVRRRMVRSAVSMLAGVTALTAFCVAGPHILAYLATAQAPWPVTFFCAAVVFPLADVGSLMLIVTGLMLLKTSNRRYQAASVAMEPNVRSIDTV